MNFSGSWEKDFARSDNWEDELSRRMQIRQENAALQASGVGLGNGPSISLGNINLNRPRRRQANLVNLARLAEYINRNSTMEIFQDRNEIRIERRGELLWFVVWKQALMKLSPASMGLRSVVGIGIN